VRVKPRSSPLNSLILIGFIVLIISALFILTTKREQGEELVILSGGNFRIMDVNVAGGSTILTNLAMPAISQRDPLQYNSPDEFQTWSPSSCSAASIAAIFSGFGKTARTADILSIMRDEKAISPQLGLYDYSVFEKVARKYGMKSSLNESRNLDAHFNNIVESLRKGTPVLVNVRDATFFPNGHFVVAARLNPDNTITVINPDPARGRPVVQEWTMDSTKTYFSRAMRSVVFVPA
jgi:Peptidase_C39 like family